MTSGSQRGTEIARVPPGRRTRTSSLIAATSAWMCSSTSAATTRSNSPSPNGSWSASPCLTSASAPSGTSPACFIAWKRSLTLASSSASMSKARTSAPWRYISNAWRPAPQPMSSTRSPGRSPRRSKSTVSNSVLLVAAVIVVGGDRLLVDLRHLGRNRPPAEQLLDPLAATGAVQLPALGVVEQGRECCLELADVAGRDQVGAQPVRADHLGDGAGAGRDERCAAGHQLRGRQGEPLVEAGHAGDLGRAHQRDQLGVADAVHEPDRVGDRQLVDELLGAAAGLGLGDQDQLDVAL